MAATIVKMRCLDYLRVPDMPIAGSSHGQKVTFRSPVVRPGVSIIDTPFSPSASVI